MGTEDARRLIEAIYDLRMAIRATGFAILMALLGIVWGIHSLRRR